MLAFFGLGAQELLLLGLVAVMVAGVALVVLLFLRSAGGSAGRVAQLEEENRRLREELDRERGGRPAPPAVPPLDRP